MKFSIRTLLASVLVFAALFGVNAQDKGTIAPDQIPGTAVYVPYPVNITLDGSLKDWKGVPVQRVTTGPALSPDKGQNQWVDFAVASDGKYLFVYLESQDTNIVAGKHEGNFWNEDSMEFYVNFSNNLLAKSYGKDMAQVNINATNIGKTAKDSLSLSGTGVSSAKVRAHVFKTKNGWAYESAMELPKNFKVEHGKNIGFQVHANGATELDRDSKLIWGSLDTDDHSYQDPSLFGRAIFFKVGSTDVPAPQSMGLTLADIFKREGAVGKAAKTLVWSDDFNYKGAPDRNKWDYDAWDVGKYNEELQIYTDSRDNSFVQDGMLTIRAIRDAKGKWTSARLLTRGKQSWKYGYIEVKAKLPAGRGTWPAIWMMPERDSYGGWPASGEIDIMEHVGFDQDKIHTSVHTQDYNHRKGTQKTRSAKIPGVSESFHTYALEWTDKAVFWYVDGEPFYFFQREPGGYGVWPFDHPFHIILNVAMGGTWGGMKGMDPAVKQADMVVDYVKVYQ